LIADWRRRLVDRRLAPSTISVALAAATSLLDSRGLRAPAVRCVGPEPRAVAREPAHARHQMKLEHVIAFRDDRDVPPWFVHRSMTPRSRAAR
jgi:hypothetical protein